MILYDCSQDVLWTNLELACLIIAAVSSIVVFLICFFFRNQEVRSAKLIGIVIAALAVAALAVTGYLKNIVMLCILLLAIIYWKRENYEIHYPIIAAILLLLLTGFLGFSAVISYQTALNNYVCGEYEIVQGVVEAHELKGDKEIFCVAEEEFYNIKKRYGYCKEKTGDILKDGMQVKIYYNGDTILYIEQR